MDQRNSLPLGGNQIQKWFMGLEQKDERLLSVEEGHHLRKRIFQLRMRPFVVFLVAAITFSLPALLIDTTYWRSELLNILVAIAGILLILIGIPVFILFSKDAFRDAAILKDDITFGRALIFKGFFSEQLKHHRTFRRLSKERLVQLGEKTEQKIEVLPCSGTIMSVNGKKPKGWWKGEVFEATNPPEQHYDVLVRPANPDENPDEQFDVLQRHLSREEKAELICYVARTKRPSGYLTFMSLWMIALILSMSLQAQKGEIVFWLDKYKLQALMICGLFLMAVVRYLRALRTARLLNQDADAGILKIIRPGPESNEKSIQEPPLVLEILPISLIGWTVDGKPFSWRYTKSRLRHHTQDPRYSFR
jgi:hypothetical protein